MEEYVNKLLNAFGASIVLSCKNVMIPPNQLERYIERCSEIKAVKRANFYWRFDKLVQKGKMTDRYLPKGHDDDPVAQMFKAIYKKGE